jgi:hypothetical protein
MTLTPDCHCYKHFTLKVCLLQDSLLRLQQHFEGATLAYFYQLLNKSLKLCSSSPMRHVQLCSHRCHLVGQECQAGAAGPNVIKLLQS